jgi:hypothetical protein
VKVLESRRARAYATCRRGLFETELGSWDMNVLFPAVKVCLGTLAELAASALAAALSERRPAADASITYVKLVAVECAEICCGHLNFTQSCIGSIIAQSYNVCICFRVSVG